MTLFDRWLGLAGDGSVGVEREHEWSWPGADGEAGPRTCRVPEWASRPGRM